MTKLAHRLWNVGFPIILLKLQLVAGCSFSGALAVAVDADAAPPSDAPGPQRLIVDGLAARYFLDEFAEGQGTVLIDSASDPFDVELHHQPGPDGSPMQFCELDPGHRGLCWSRFGDDSNASRSSDGSKLESLFANATMLTIELVATIEEVDPDGSRLFQFGPEGANTQRGVTVLSHELGTLSLAFGASDGDVAKVITTSGLDEGRVVVHAVVDSNASDEARRLRLIVNGLEATLAPDDCARGPCGFADRGVAVDARSYALTLGNRQLGDRSFAGALHYGAL